MHRWYRPGNLSALSCQLRFQVVLCYAPLVLNQSNELAVAFSLRRREEANGLLTFLPEIYAPSLPRRRLIFFSGIRCIDDALPGHFELGNRSRNASSIVQVLLKRHPLLLILFLISKGC